MTEPTSAPSASTAEPRPARPTINRKKAGKASRYLAAGGAVGASLVIVGGLAAASSAQTEQSPQPLIERVVVVPEANSPAPQQIIIVIPDNANGATGAAVVEPTVSIVEATVPPRDPAPAAVTRVQRAPAPVTQSAGS